MGLASNVAGEFDKGILLFFMIVKWVVIIFIACSFAVFLYWILQKIVFYSQSLFNMFPRKKTKKKKKKK